MAISAFYIHRRAVTQVLDRLIEIRRNSPPKNRSHAYITDDEEDFEEEEEENMDNDEEYGFNGELIMDGKMWGQSLSRSLDDKSMLRSYRMSCSMPNAVMNNDWFDEDVKFEQPPLRLSCLGENLDFIPSGLPPLQTAPRDGNHII